MLKNLRGETHQLQPLASTRVVVEVAVVAAAVEIAVAFSGTEIAIEIAVTFEGAATFETLAATAIEAIVEIMSALKMTPK